jgi:hypothetical protein
MPYHTEPYAGRGLRPTDLRRWALASWRQSAVKLNE